MRVLIVDDSEPMRRMIKTYLADLIGEIFECGDGSEALNA
jgi:CheY-like chemotaxis protein